MGKRYVDRDPTADAAIGNVDRERQHRATEPGLMDLHPDAFTGLKPHEASELVMSAWLLSGSGSVSAITREHLEQARAAL